MCRLSIRESRRCLVLHPVIFVNCACVMMIRRLDVNVPDRAMLNICAHVRPFYSNYGWQLYVIRLGRCHANMQLLEEGL